MSKMKLQIGGTTKFFKDDEEFREFIQSELAHWEWVSRQTGACGTAAHNKICRDWGAVQKEISEGPVSANLKARLEGFNIPLSSSPEAQAIEELRAESDQLAAATLASLLGVGFNNQELGTGLAGRGIAESVLIRRGITKSTVAANARAHKLEVKRAYAAAADLEELIQQYAVMQKVAEQEQEDNESARHEAFLSQLKVFKEEHSAALDLEQQELENLKTHYEEFMKVQAPVNYWEERRQYHLSQSKRFGWSFAILLVIVIGLIFVGSAAVFPALWRTAFAVAGIELPNVVPARSTEPQLEAVAVLALLVTPALWGLRMLARSLVSHSHMAADAAERVTMIQTYLAFLSDTKVTEEERTILLQALFRPGATGLVKEDLYSAGLLEVFRAPFSK